MSFGDRHDFEVPLAHDEVAWIKERVRAYRWFEEPSEAGWQYGANEDYLRRLRRFWLDHFSWRFTAGKLNDFPHFKVDVGDDMQLHCIHRRAADPNAIPLLLCHGWPGSIAEFAPIIDQLAEPSDPNLPSFHVIAPSLPGYAWSDKPKRPIGPRTVAVMYERLMQALGYTSYLVQGGDWGSVIAGWLGLEGDACRALHLNGYGLRVADHAPQSEHESAWLRQMRLLRKTEMGYFEVQATKPQSLSYAMMDSPMGVAAWFVEKFTTWGDRDVSAEITSVAHPERETGNKEIDAVGLSALPTDPPFKMDWLLTNIMIYLTTRSFNTATWLYRGMAEEREYVMPSGHHVAKPTAVASFPKDLLAFPPRTMMERGYNIQQWSDMPRGGHFPSLEAPELFIADLRKFAGHLLQTSVF